MPARGVPPFNRQPGSAQNIKRPVAPPVYRPQPVPKVLQAKSRPAGQVHPTSLQSKPAVVAPRAYRPLPVPKVLQSKIAVVKQTPAVPKTGSPAMRLVNRPQTLAPHAQRSVQTRTVQPKTAVPVRAHIPSRGTNTIQRMHPHLTDSGTDFLIKYPYPTSSTSVGTYEAPQWDTYQLETNNYTHYRFATRTRGSVSVPHQQIISYRPTVGGMHPRGMIRPEQERIEGRSQVFLSEADLSGVMARQRKDPRLLETMVVTTFEQEPDYPDFTENLLSLEGLGVPVLRNFDISDPNTAERLNTLAPNANIHFQMPRVPRITGYSTQQLITDTLEMPHRLQRSDITSSITVPHPTMYKKPKTHNQHYGLESGKTFGKNELVKAESDSDDDLEHYGYTHKQSTKDQSAQVSEKRKKYRFKSKLPYDIRTEDEINKNQWREDRDDDDVGGGLTGNLFSKG